jgi:hypothetical protein
MSDTASTTPEQPSPKSETDDRREKLAAARDILDQIEDAMDEIDRATDLITDLTQELESELELLEVSSPEVEQLTDELDNVGLPAGLSLCVDRLRDVIVGSDEPDDDTDSAHTLPETHQHASANEGPTS